MGDGGVATRGKRIGRYELVQQLGEGGMGTVWLAHPEGAPDELYAIKTVAAHYAADARVCTMFVKEARLAAAIDHPNVVRLYDVGLQDDVPFYVMEWIDGFSLRNVARTVAESGERVPPGVALRIASDLCAGLHAAHELTDEDGKNLGLVHRDVSPHNVLVTREGVAKLIDFGVAKAKDIATGSDKSVVDGLKGKVRYMAPEQALDQPIDRRADLFSVGAITYQLLTGRAPFEGPNELATINALLSTNPVFIPDELPEPVKWILRRALARRPENRFTDAEEMHGSIEVALVELALRDQHSDVAECLAWFDPRDDDEAFTSSLERSPSALPSIDEPDGEPKTDTLPMPAPVEASDDKTTIDVPPVFPAPIARSAAEIPARRSSLPDTGVLPATRPPSRRRGALVGGVTAAIALLGIGIVALTCETQPDASEPARSASSAAVLPPITEPSAAPAAPVVDMGDLEESKPAPSTKPRVRRLPRSGTSSGPKILKLPR